ncbi:MAG: hypothetical protein WC742_12515 [Gallionellaceae bacterium]|jgi:hypothetical protein
MNNEELLKELESLVCAMEESLAIITGTISETSDPVKTFQNILAGEEALQKTHGPNEWRDRLMQSARKIAALKARNDLNDPALQTLISNVLSGRVDSDKSH